MNILLLGSTGQLGWELQRALAPLGKVTALDRAGNRPDGLCGDLSQPEVLAATVRTLRPDLIVNAAAHTAVDKAESEPELAQAINATAPTVLGREAAALGAMLVHYSTDYVFDGTGEWARDEAAPTGPLSTYGSTKLEGEQGIQASGCKHLILRTSWVYGARGGNFAKTMLRLAGEREQLNVIDDQIGAPTGADLLADLTAHAVSQWQRQPELGGLYHLVAGGETSWHGYAQHVIEWARGHGQAIKVVPANVKPIPTAAYPTPATRPLNSRLSTAKFRTAFGLSLPHWQTGVDRMLTEVLG